MKTRFPSILGVFAAILMVASFVIPVNLSAPAAVTADLGIAEWDTIVTAPVVGINTGPPIVTESLTKACWPKFFANDTISGPMASSPPRTGSDLSLVISYGSNITMVLRAIVATADIGHLRSITAIVGNVWPRVYPTDITQAGAGYNNTVHLDFSYIKSVKLDIYPGACSGNAARTIIGISRWVIIDGNGSSRVLVCSQVVPKSSSSKPAGLNLDRTILAVNNYQFDASLCGFTGTAHSA